MTEVVEIALLGEQALDKGPQGNMNAWKAAGLTL